MSWIFGHKPTKAYKRTIRNRFSLPFSPTHTHRYTLNKVLFLKHLRNGSSSICSMMYHSHRHEKMISNNHHVRQDPRQVICFYFAREGRWVYIIKSSSKIQKANAHFCQAFTHKLTSLITPVQVNCCKIQKFLVQ